MPYHLKSWGSFELWLEGAPTQLPTRKAMALVVYLALEGPQPRSVLARLLWDLTEERSRANLRRELLRLREAAPALLKSEGDTLELLNCTSDVSAFQTFFKAHDWQQAITLRRSVFLEDFSLEDAPEFEDWLTLKRARLEEDYLHSALQLAALQETLEVDAIQAYQLALRCDALAERAVQGLMRCYLKQGKTREAAQVFKDFKQDLKRELGIAPARETLALLETLQPVNAAPKSNPALVISPLPKDFETPLVGREKEWARLEAAWQKGQVVYISGEPGVGKTRLMLEFARSKGRYHLVEGRPTDATVPFSTVTRVMRELLVTADTTLLPAWVKGEVSRILPELAESPPAAFPNHESQRFVDAIIYYNMQLVPQLNIATSVNDDIQFWDAASAQLGARIAPEVQTQSQPWRVFCAYRKGELPPEVEQGIRATAETGQAVLIELEPLSQSSVEHLLENFKLSHASEMLYAFTGGNPLFVIETAKALQAQTTDSPSLPRTAKVNQVIQQRLEKLSKNARDILRIAAIANPHFNLQLAQVILEPNPTALIEANEELERMGVLKQSRFAHDLLYEAVLESIPPSTRVLLHNRVAECFANMGANLGLIANHRFEGGQHTVAVKTWLEAAKYYEERGLPEASIEMLERVHRHSEDPVIRLDSLSQLALAYYSAGRWNECQKAAQQLVHVTPDLLLQARAYAALAISSIELGDYHGGNRATDEAMKLLGQLQQTHNPFLLIELRSAIGRALFFLDRFQDILTHFAPLIDMAKMMPPNLQQVSLYNGVACAYTSVGQYEKSEPLHRQALAVAELLKSPWANYNASIGMLLFMLCTKRLEPGLLVAAEENLKHSYGTNDVPRAELATAYLMLNQPAKAKLLCQDMVASNVSPMGKTIALAHLSEIQFGEGHITEAQQGLDQCLKSLAGITYPWVVGTVAAAVLSCGTPVQKERLQPYLAKLEVAKLWPYLRERLQQLQQ